MDNKMDIIPAFMKLSVEKTWLKGKPKKKQQQKTATILKNHNTRKH